MGSKLSRRLTPMRREKVVPVVPNIPPEILEEILDHVARSDSRHLQSCSLVSTLWAPPCQRRLFHTITFTSETVEKWLQTFPVPAESPALYVKDLCFSLRVYNDAPEEFFGSILWFTNVERVTLRGPGWFRPLWTPSSVRLPHSITSLTVDTDETPLAQIRNFMVQLPNLNDLSLSGSSVEVDNNTPPGMGGTLRGRFGGQLRLLKGHADTNIMDMLLEVPTGLHFTVVEIRSTHECLFSTVRLAEACSRTLVKLSYKVSNYGKFHPFSWSSWF